MDYQVQVIDLEKITDKMIGGTSMNVFNNEVLFLHIVFYTVWQLICPETIWVN